MSLWREDPESSFRTLGDLDLSTLLRHFMDEARTMTGVRYCPFGVLNDDRGAQVGLDGKTRPSTAADGLRTTTLTRRTPSIRYNRAWNRSGIHSRIPRTSRDQWRRDPTKGLPAVGNERSPTRAFSRT